ncbi:hypothetical protein TVAG_471540 [Trichomonas vaginalis G3]|uniref:E2F/DP family winged-helix DNA-binding domain-containing protein n=1 Tax=Trichomonas vaginalis (strain ATCC PRA-98 / G3) TaxID=412133 RepID=A2FZI2_TRIV3|nr:e2F-like (mammalian transcription factor) family [Trichomonas vaginalis G3]EAX89682.1 hypothetical protein TVAG_471540 [Trichomonas vaginalis G3]KAI5536257.1 e2F-like (mammalian transcription factor) family [Trichomonas vaginalis G3]|eukprot:XP_001302612.1 hypothetical protein [Trichomonas vaginalis G3]
MISLIDYGSYEVLKECPPTHKKNDKESKSITEIFGKMVKHFENHHSKNLNVMNVSLQFNIQSRRVYDFFNVFSALGVCKSQYKGSISWLSVNNIADTIKKAYYEIEVDSDNFSFQELFSFEQSPSLGALAIRFITLYFFLNVNILCIHDVATLFLNPTSDRKSLERRLYLVLGILEIVGLVHHSQRTGEYRITINTEEVVLEVLELKKKNLKNYSILSLLNTVNQKYLDTIFPLRREEYLKIVQG